MRLLAGVKDAAWGSSLGRLYLNDKLTAGQFGAGKRWAELVRAYDEACRAPNAPRTVNLELGGGGQEADPDSLAGVKEARHHLRIIEIHSASVTALRMAGGAAHRAVVVVDEIGEAPTGEAELAALRVGLQALITLWSGSKRARKESANTGAIAY